MPANGDEQFSVDGDLGFDEWLEEADRNPEQDSTHSSKHQSRMQVRRDGRPRERER